MISGDGGDDDDGGRWRGACNRALAHTAIAQKMSTCDSEREKGRTPAIVRLRRRRSPLAAATARRPPRRRAQSHTASL